MKKIRKIIAVILSLTMVAAMSLSFTGCGSEKPTYKYLLRFGHTLTEKDAFHKYMLEWADEVNKKTNGDVKIEIYASSQLGKEEDVIEQIRQGANIGWITDFARLGTYVNELSVVNAPYFVDNDEEAFKLKDSKTVKDLNNKLATEYGIDNISFDWIQGARNVFSNTVAKNPSEMSGLLIRTAPAPVWVKSVNALGCTATALSYGEIYSGIQTKVVDGCELPYNAAKNIKISEVCKNVMETGHIFQLNSIIVSKDWMDKLPKEYQQILIDECNKAGKKASDAVKKENEDGKQAMIDAGINVISPDQLDMAAFRKAGDKAYEELGLKEVRDSIYKDIGKQVRSN